MENLITVTMTSFRSYYKTYTLKLSWASSNNNVFVTNWKPLLRNNQICKGNGIISLTTIILKTVFINAFIKLKIYEAPPTCLSRAYCVFPLRLINAICIFSFASKIIVKPNFDCTMVVVLEVIWCVFYKVTK